MKNTLVTLIALIAFGCGGSNDAPAPSAQTEPTSETPPANEAPAEEEQTAAAEEPAADDGEEEGEPLVPADFEEDAIESITSENIETEVEELAAALSAEGDDDEEDEAAD